MAGDGAHGGRTGTGTVPIDRRLLTAAALLAAGAATAPDAAPAAAAGMRFGHVSPKVRDFDAALAWYGGKRGFRVGAAWRVAALGGERLAHLRLKDAVQEPVEADPGGVGPPEAAAFPEHFGRTGYGHLGFRVGSADAAPDGLAAEGLPAFVGAGTHDLGGTPFRRRVGFVKGMEGDAIEFVEPLRRA